MSTSERFYGATPSAPRSGNETAAEVEPKAAAIETGDPGEIVQAVACLACGEGHATCPPQFPDNPGYVEGNCGYCGAPMIWAAEPVTRRELAEIKQSHSMGRDGDDA